jgi:hypothetical protein
MNDAFGRLRVSNPYTLFEYYPSSDTVNNDYDADQWVSNGSGSGSLSYDTSEHTISLTAPGIGDKYTRETKYPIQYQAGKSRLIYISSIPISSNPSSNDVTVRIGLAGLDSSQDVIEGHYFKINQNNLYWSYSYNSTTSDIVQTSWNIDQFDGSGPSGISLSITSMTTNILFVIDQEWLGVGRVRVGFNLNGINYYAHQFIANNTYPYTTTPRLPIIYQIENNSSTSYTTKQICCVSISEGGYLPIGKRISISNDVVAVTIPDTNEKYILLGLRLKSTSVTNILKLLSLDVLFPEGSTTKWGVIELQLHSTGLGDYPVGGSIGATTGTISFTDISKSASQVFNPTGTLSAYVSTDGYILTTKYMIQKSTFSFTGSEYSTLLKRSQISKYDTLYIVGKLNSGTNTKISVALDFIETV